MFFKRKSSRIQGLTEKVEDLKVENRALWSRMVELENERRAHDGTMNCPGCADEVQRHIDDLDIDSLIPGGLHSYVRSIVIEELNSWEEKS